MGGGFQNHGEGTGLGQRPEMQEQIPTDEFLATEIEQDRQNRLMSPIASQMHVQNNDASVILAEKNRVRIASAAIMQERKNGIPHKQPATRRQTARLETTVHAKRFQPRQRQAYTRRPRPTSYEQRQGKAKPISEAKRHTTEDVAENGQ